MRRPASPVPSSSSSLSLATPLATDRQICDCQYHANFTINSRRRPNHHIQVPAAVGKPREPLHQNQYTHIPILLIVNIAIFAVSLFVGSPSKVGLVSAADVVKHVTCNSVVKLENESKPKIRLHSHDIKYGSGSGQQSVTAVEDQDTNSYWSILGEKDKPCNRGEPVECGSKIRLQHVQTRKFLHSHLFKSPLSSQQEVSAFGDDNDSDTGDHWVVYCKSRFWQKTEPVRLRHADTQAWLSLSGNLYGRPIFGQMEVVCAESNDAASYWRTAEGVYVQPTTSSSSSDTTQAEHDEL